jgi:ferredoxin
MAEMSDTWQGIARDAIDWAPETDESLCIGCGLCVTENNVLVEVKGKLEEMRVAGEDKGQG